MTHNIGQLVLGLPAPYREVNFYYRTKGWSRAAHDHPWHQFIFITEGVLHLYDEQGRCIPMQRGQICLIPPKYEHALYTEDGYHQVGVNFSRDKDQRGVTALMDSFVTTLRIMNAPEFLETVTDLQERCSLMTTLSKLRVAATLDQFFVSLVESSSTVTEIHFRNRLLDYLREHLSSKTTLQELCVHMRLSQSHMERLTFQEFGCGVIELHNRLRLNQACTYLANSGHTLAEIAERLGFYDQSHFSHFFKRKMKRSPSEYRKLVREQGQ